MDMSDQMKVKQVCAQLAFLMEHQEILPDLKEIIAEKLTENSSDYLRGAQDALNHLVTLLEQKGR